MEVPKFTDSQVAEIITKTAELFEEDARPLLIAHMYEMAYKYNENGNSALFAAEVAKLLKKMEDLCNRAV